MSNYLERSKVYKGYHYSILKPEMLEYLHNRTLEMMKVVLPIFDHYKIRYALVGGTLLGGVTRGKFIPWDDDFDVAVFEEDYDKMVEVLLKELPDGMILQCNKTEPKYYLDWVKIRDQYSEVLPGVPLYKENGVWIDLYKLRKVRKSKAAYIIQKGHFDYVKRRYKLGGLTTEEYSERLKKGMIRQKTFVEWVKSLFSLKKGNIYIIWSASKVLVEEQWVLPLKQYMLEGVQMTSFGRAEEYLLQHYGENYKEWPREDLRRVGITKVFFKKNADKL